MRETGEENTAITKQLPKAQELAITIPLNAGVNHGMQKKN